MPYPTAIADARVGAPDVHEPMTAEWWRTAVVYEVYPRSFRDANGDGIGDLEGVRRSLPYLQGLGVDPIWFNRWYRAPLADGGYDVEDCRDIDPAFGTQAQAERLIAEARERGIRTIIDVVPNHVSERHPWFTEALADEPGEWYLHLCAAEQAWRGQRTGSGRGSRITTAVSDDRRAAKSSSPVSISRHVDHKRDRSSPRAARACTRRVPSRTTTFASGWACRLSHHAGSGSAQPFMAIVTRFGPSSK